MILAYLVMIDVKDGVYDAIHLFGSRTVAEQYVAWNDTRGGDHCYIVEMPCELEWNPPVEAPPAQALL